MLVDDPGRAGLTPTELFDQLVRSVARQGRIEDAKWMRAHRDEVMAAIVAAQGEPTGSLWRRFSRLSAPASGERGYRPMGGSVRSGGYDGRGGDLAGLASDLLTCAMVLIGEPEIGQLWQVAQDEGRPERRRVAALVEMADLLGVPATGHSGRVLTPEERAGSAEFLVELALETDPLSWGGTCLQVDERHERLRGQQDRPGPGGRRPPNEGWGALPRWLAAAILQDAMDRDAVLRLVAVPRQAAADFIAQHHSQLPAWPPRTMYAVGAQVGQRLVAVATAGHPTGRWADQCNVLELTRVASDGTTKNAASMLVARILDLLPLSGRGDPSAPVLFVTYQLTTEDGSTYRSLADKGLRPVLIKPGSKHRKAGGRRGTVKALADLDKVRWEAGPAAGPADWSLLEGAPSVLVGE